MSRNRLLKCSEEGKIRKENVLKIRRYETWIETTKTNSGRKNEVKATRKAGYKKKELRKFKKWKNAGIIYKLIF